MAKKKELKKNYLFSIKPSTRYEKLETLVNHYHFKSASAYIEMLIENEFKKLNKKSKDVN